MTPIFEKDKPIATLASSEIENGKFKVHSNTYTKFNWIVYGLRQPLIVEPNKSDVQVKGQGPYKWYELN